MFSANTISQSVLDQCRQWLDGVEIKNARVAHFLCQLIPMQCPFARDIECFGLTLHIPPLCKLNPLYEEVVSLRFRALCYLSDTCQEDVRRYC
ncbi:nitrogenase [[Limnothrix rosea] IAM M-220]|nr:nitrogenase [[Limnothrix rosea] IAM M-220]